MLRAGFASLMGQGRELTGRAAVAVILEVARTVHAEPGSKLTRTHFTRGLGPVVFLTQQVRVRPCLRVRVRARARSQPRSGPRAAR